MSRKLQFRVSAKTARLIGRENVATADGAISELVKNSYDADARICIIALTKKYDEMPDRISAAEYKWFLSRFPNAGDWFEKDHATFKIKEGLSTSDQASLDEHIGRIRELWIVDNGAGMSASAIENHWMVIGTNFKEKNHLSRKGRTRTGAKGIGRFALDRLGAEATVSSRIKTDEGLFRSLTWSVDWGAFEDEDAALDEITANLEDDTGDYIEAIQKITSFETIHKVIEEASVATYAGTREPLSFDTGTSIKVSLLRDEWDSEAVETLRRSLSSLVPPDEQASFRIVMFDDVSPMNDVEIVSEILSDFDYKIEAEFSADGTAEIKIWRNELNVDEFPTALFDRPDMKGDQFKRESFFSAPVSYTRSLEQLLGAKRNNKVLQAARNVGPFKVTLRFYKLALASRDDQEKYPYRSFQPGPRRAWLDRYAGIKIYRDNFFVRPYGETGGRAFDWLGLGGRRAANPVQPSRKTWPVPPQNISGTVEISRSKNPRLSDQSNREAIAESAEFDAFRELITRIIKEFEKDRSTIHFNLLEVFKAANHEEEVRQEGERIAEKVVEEAGRKNDAGNPSAPKAMDVADPTLTLSKTVQFQRAEIEELKEEQVMLRSLATLGTVLVSFSHEMGQLQNAMGSRSLEMSDLLADIIPREIAFKEKPAFNPYVLLDDWLDEDRKIKQWFSFVLGSVRPERRRQKNINVKDYLADLSTSWEGFLAPRHVQLQIDFSADPLVEFVAYEIDVDSIFNNLILNSVEAFVEQPHSEDRRILISIKDGGQGELIVAYSDNGPGLDSSISKPNDIFEFAVTTKRDSSGKTVGTGLGMWIMESIVRNYGGVAEVKAGQLGFAVELRLPVSKRDVNDSVAVH
ncbi:GHKL domain-containing protein [Rhizobium rhizogenes]|uniref:histidine kinase n=1 Tax=Rhizobium rhizogenes TaxID=359 RepID=A0AA88F387_RHIRH|nr:sensor histidine kinase [Rhizobium rhizogenes]KAA3502764.1 GHKL domain-containing protein [Rhizobium rhizogenes]